MVYNACAVMTMLVFRPYPKEYYDLDKHLYRKDSDGDPNQTTKTGAGIDIRDGTTMKSTFYNKETGKRLLSES